MMLLFWQLVFFGSQVIGCSLFSVTVSDCKDANLAANDAAMFATAETKPKKQETNRNKNKNTFFSLMFKIIKNNNFFLIYCLCFYFMVYLIKQLNSIHANCSIVTIS